MGALSLITVLVLKLGIVFGYAIEPSITWPTEYHFSGESIDLFSGVVKPFEIWYSEDRNKSRADYYGGLVRRIFDGAAKGGEESDSYYDDDSSSTTVYMFHTKADKSEKPLVECEKITSSFIDFEDFLPDLEDFYFAGNSFHSGKEVAVWKKEEDEEEIEHRTTLYVTKEYAPHEEDFVILPLQMDTKAFEKMNGALRSHEIVNYYSFHAANSDDDFKVKEDECPEINPFSFEWAHTRLSPHIESDVNIAFNAYKKHHKREYKDAEHKRRKQIYHSNWKLVKDHNDQDLGYKLTMNHFADRTEEELKYLAATKFTEPVVGTHEFPYTLESVNDAASDLPEEVDLRSEGYVTPVKNQASCGSCWAFASTSTVESAVAKSLGGQMVDLSEQSLVDCAWNYASHGCEGSESIGAVYGYLKQYGLPTVREYGPYLGEDGECKIKNMTDAYQIRGYVAVTPYSSNALKVALFNTGPVTVGVQVTRKMKFYASGVFYDTDCMPDRLNHAVVAVGYGYRFGDLYWIIKNSWGESWGQDGYFLISANDNNCGITASPVYPVV